MKKFNEKENLIHKYRDCFQYWGFKFENFFQFEKVSEVSFNIFCVIF